MKDTIRTLRSININLLPILAELLRCKNVTHAAAFLNLTQSTVSGSLRQLREIFGDDLLIQHGREMELTNRARQLVPALERLIEAAGELFQPNDFNPLTSEINFRVATADYVSGLVAIRVGKLLQTQAPWISFTLMPTPGSTAKDLRVGRLDLIICPNRQANWEAFGISNNDQEFDRDVFMDDMWVAIQWSGHPSAGKELSINEYFARPHAIYVRTDGRNTIEQNTLEIYGLNQINRFFVPYFTLLPQLVVESDLVALIPASLANQYTKIFPICAFRPPYELPRLELAMAWARSRESDMSLRWLRTIIREATSEQE